MLDSDIDLLILESEQECKKEKFELEFLYIENYIYREIKEKNNNSDEIKSRVIVINNK